ncbi:MAG: branched-chain amino acid transaminase [Deltaproteobacteria bacterium]|nr:branched-chain amino acid transaminase [Deltaproteobacteria bacterium]MCW5804540.1 branched-chain amino acid transaminase [Deltaproteobacteria bacterium]
MGIKKLDTIWFDGQLVPWDAATDHLLAHTMHYGVGAFEGIRCYQRADGKSAIFRLREHIDRLLDSSIICTMDVPFSRDQLMNACIEVVRANKIASCYLRPLVYLGYGALGLGSLEPPVRTMVACYEWGAYLGDDGLKKGIKCMVSGFARSNANAVMNKGKICGQYVTSVLAKRMAIKSGFEEALMLDPQGYVAEGTGENIFVVKNNVVRTPPTSAAILAGITRDTAMTLLREHGFEVREDPIARDELYTAEEVFLTGTAAEITPVRDIDHRRIGRGEAGPITRRLQESFFSVVKGTDTKHDHWLTPI